jgi:SAM-dependent methyltransferase
MRVSVQAVADPRVASTPAIPSRPVLAAARDVTLHAAILADLGHALDPTSTILDFGCGDGYLVEAYRRAGFQAVGADINLPRPHNWLHQIDPSNYRLPFRDRVFDVVVSNSVLEHVEDLDGALAEIARVLKPGGASLHFFPPPWRFVEQHVFVPLSGVLRPRWWLQVWARLGVRNSFQRGLSWRETARRNREYLQTKTFYRSRRALRAVVGARFERVTFATRSMIRRSYGRARHLSPVAPLVERLYDTFHYRCLFFENRRGTSNQPIDRGDADAPPNSV